MDEAEALERLRKKDEAALVWLIERYAPYVNTVIYNIIGTVASPCDVEEVSSDIFLVLWQNADAVQEGKLKAYLGAVARIAEELNMNLSTVKTRLRRGREKLKDELKRRGCDVE